MNNMLLGPALLFLVSSSISTADVAAQQQETPVDVSPCLLMDNPGAYHHKLVRVHSEISFGFEDFALSGQECGSPQDRTNVWLEFGGDVGGQTIYCCGDHSRLPQAELKIDEYSIPLDKDQDLSKFLELLKAERNKAPNGGPCYDCYYYRVTATLVGRFFAGGRANKKQSAPLPQVGYGHLGCCSLLAIEKVSEVSAARTEIPKNARFRCRKQNWKWMSAAWSDKSDRIAKVEGEEESWRTEDYERVAVEAIRHLAEEWHSRLPTTQPQIYRDESGRFEKAKGTWTSADLLLTFTISMRRLRELEPETSGRAKEMWIPYEVTRETCVAKN